MDDKFFPSVDCGSLAALMPRLDWHGYYRGELMQATVKWVDGAQFLGESGSGHSVVMDGPADTVAAIPAFALWRCYFWVWGGAQVLM